MGKKSESYSFMREFQHLYAETRIPEILCLVQDFLDSIISCRFENGINTSLFEEFGLFKKEDREVKT